jgi:hypothetical protein
MPKPPFNYKPTHKRITVQQGLKLSGASEIPASYSDTFVVLNEAETGMASLYFYQRQFDDSKTTEYGTTEGDLYGGAKCISRIVMSRVAIDKLLIALAENRGFNLVPRESGEDKK